MKLFAAAALGLVLAPALVHAKAVFAHFMVGNTDNFTEADWKNDISLAQAAGIDAFALNMAYQDDVNTKQVPNAFSAAEALGFSLFFSFDYAGNGPWDKATVTDLINARKGSSAYYLYNGKPFVSTFEGPGNAADWVDIKSSTGCFFIPDWSSLGAKAAVQLGTADGLFSWAAWPDTADGMNTYGDASYFDFLDGMPYMAPVSPWFYTNLPGYSKNWLWMSDNLWFDRWQQLIVGELQPDFLEIISWNDFGESHYIGPLDDRQYTAFSADYGNAPFNYVEGMPHDGWRQFLPFVIELWKTGTATVGTEGVVSWYRPNPVAACSDNDTTFNTASQLQLESLPSSVLKDKVTFTALLASAADATVVIGGKSIAGTWSTVPYGGVGLYHGSVNTTGATGSVVVEISRNGQTIMQTSGGGSITTTCTSGYNNFNAYVDSGTGGSSSVTTPAAISDLVPTAGFGVYNFAGLCNFTCTYGYCPEAACTRTNLGTQITKPASTGVLGYPLEGESVAYSGLCTFACNLGFCPDTACGTVKEPTHEGNVSPFVPPTCTNGTGEGNLAGLCSYSCNYGMCPIHSCTCLTTGDLITPPASDTTIKGFSDDGTKDYGLCSFACPQGYCPLPCGSKRIDTDPDDDDASPTGTVAYVPSPTCASTQSASSYLTQPTADADEIPISTNSYFSVDRNCYSDTSGVEHNQGYANRGKFYEQAYKDAAILADSALDWPTYGTDASDLYFGKGTDGDTYSADIHKNLEMIANWDSPKLGFDNYIVLGCPPGGKAMGGDCNRRQGGDPRPMACFVNNTRSWWWNKSYIWCCDLYFSSESIEWRHTARADDDPDNLDLRNFMTSGSMLLHEMLHTLEITGTNGERQHIIDEKFDGSRGKRIYGPVDVENAARQYGPGLTTKNADSYAQFASAHYWQKRYGGKVPQPKVTPSVLDTSYYFESIDDASSSYVDQCVAAPSDWNCDCDEDGCPDTAAPCCASGTCTCDCDDDGCPPPNPSCCGSGTCKWGS